MEDFIKIYEEYYRDVFRFLNKLSGYNADLAEELTQETFYHAYLSLTAFKGQCHIKTWILQIAKNRFFTYCRKNRQVPLGVEELESELTGESLWDKIGDRQLLMSAWKIIESMAPAMRDIMIYRIYSDLSYHQISQWLGITENSAKVIYYRGKNLLRTRLREEYGYEI